MNPDMIKAIAELVKSVSWPIIVLILIFSQRKAVASFLENLESLTLPGGVEAKIKKKVDKETEAVIREENPQTVTSPSPRQLEAAERVQRLATSADFSTVRVQMDELAREYERVRASMPASDDRTRRMTVVTTKMRTLGLAAAPLLAELTESESTGKRLAATVILQMTPKPEYIEWLTNRFRIEKPFIAYHAAVALEVASRVFGRDQQENLKQSIHLAKEYVGASRTASDRWNVLDRAEKNLEETA